MDGKSPDKDQRRDLHGTSFVAPDGEFEDIVRGNIAWMLAVARRILRDPSMAEDAVQLAFAKIHRKLEGFEGKSRLSTWMHRIVVNEALMMLRKQKRENVHPIDPLLPEFDANGCRVDDPFTVSETSEDQLQSRQVREIMKEKIDELPEPYRIVLVLRDIEEMPTSDVAEALEMSEANVKVRLHRARAALKKLLEPMMRGGAL
ncbi:sigma-70 family RNA polymerase sigma factor [uncultured Tateyamaria sp.]|uniref:sigma-70 family RNA polymerase sigma factor n=1 Tax=uncultured Tateyamaria sp. TaxID=455651 RepID=UPI0026359875|nr:sigma-70 family RNA polymerase sigma factor [uncultured Tateyamaria sp.]